MWAERPPSSDPLSSCELLFATLSTVDRYQDVVETQIREALERGDFDDLPGTGQPLNLKDEGPAWWARRKIEQIKAEDRITEIGREVQDQIDQMWSLPDEESVSEAAADLNQRIEALNSQLPGDAAIPVIDPAEATRTWRSMFRIRQRPTN